MIGIGVPQVTTEDSRMDDQPIVGLPHMTAEAIKFGLQGSQPIGLMAADMCNTSQVAGVTGKCGDRRDHRRQLRDTAQIKINSMDMISSLHPEVAAFQAYAGAEGPQDVADCVARLDRGTRPVRDCDRASSDRGRSEKRC